jgi:hypothetical protein
MKRVMAVLLVFALLTGISGVHEVSLGADQGEATSPKHRRKIAERVAKIPPNSVVEIEQTDETEFKAVLLDATPDAITVSLLEEPDRGRKVTIPISAIEDIEQVRGRALRTTLIVLGITGAALVAPGWRLCRLAQRVAAAAVASVGDPFSTRGVQAVGRGPNLHDVGQHDP